MIAEILARIEPLLPLFILASLRIGVAIAALPAPFGDLAPVRTRTALGVLLAIAVTLPLTAAAPEIPLEAVPLLRAAVGELLIGAVIGLTARVTLAAAQVAGTLAGNAMGLGFASTVDPTFGEDGLPTTYLLAAFGTLIFFALQGHHAVLAALAESLRLAPPGGAVGVLANDGIFRMGSATVAHGLRIAAPVVATMFIVQLGTGLVSRAAPRLNVFALSFGIAIAAGLLTLFVAAPTLARAVAVEISSLPDALRAALVGR
ncbi:MAG: flagellar biosynthetic protein FliR [Deltaproteobacteria bacterium]|nr:flagellar biosynthetic protein FliR [Deltaproteobacteria bacterium]